MDPILTSIHIAHTPPEQRVHVAFARNLHNAASLKHNLLSSSTSSQGHDDIASSFALIDAALILSRTHLLAATFRALNDGKERRMKTRNLHAEIVYCLGHTNNIASTLRDFGLAQTTKDLIVVHVSQSNGGGDEVARRIGKTVEAEIWADFSEAEIQECSDVGRIRKLYKLHTNGPGKKKDNAGDKRAKDAKKARRRERVAGLVQGTEDKEEEEDKEMGLADEDNGQENIIDDAERRELEMQILGLMALRGAT